MVKLTHFLFALAGLTAVEFSAAKQEDLFKEFKSQKAHADRHEKLRHLFTDINMEEVQERRKSMKERAAMAAEETKEYDKKAREELKAKREARARDRA